MPLGEAVFARQHCLSSLGFTSSPRYLPHTTSALIKQTRDGPNLPSSIAKFNSEPKEEDVARLDLYRGKRLARRGRARERETDEGLLFLLIFFQSR